MQEIVKEFLINSPGYLKKSPIKIAIRLNIECSYENLAIIKNIMKDIKKDKPSNLSTFSKKIIDEALKTNYKFYQEEKKNYLNVDDFKSEDTKKKEYIQSANKALVNVLEEYITEKDYEAAIKLLKIIKDKSRVLIIGDIHEPFSKKGYLEFCKEQYNKYECNKVVFIGDIIDQHFSSFHPTDPDGFGAGEELDRAIIKIQDWYKVFPEATIILGNHDRMAYRKAYSGGISSRWLRSYGDVLNTPNWKFEEKVIIDNILYIHGESGTARSKCKDIAMSTVQGHLHSQAYVEYINNEIFGMQVGCGIDDDLYAFNYNKAGKESILSCGVVIEGKPILIKM